MTAWRHEIKELRVAWASTLSKPSGATV